MGASCHELLDEAHRLLLSATEQGCTATLDPRTTLWLIREKAWFEILRHEMMRFTGGQKRLMGLPVRVTVADEPDVPLIQLLMEPLFTPRRYDLRPNPGSRDRRSG